MRAAATSPVRARRGILAAAAFLAIAPAVAFSLSASDLVLPAGAARTAEAVERNSGFPIATGPWDGTSVPLTEARGQVTTTAWRITGSSASTLEVLAPLAAQIAAEGFETLYECAAAQCGGFDFRFAVPVLPAPEMHVDLGDYRYLAARREGSGGAEYVNVLVSRSADTAFVQFTRIGPPPAIAAQVSTSGIAETPPAPDVGEPEAAADADFAARLEGSGTVALDDLVFETGAATLAEASYPSLTALAAYLRANPAARVTLVGHTDFQGPLAANIALSRRRAEAVAERLSAAYGIPRDQLDAEGVGYLAPRTTNLTDEGRRKNRRVEAMLTSTR